MRWVVLHAGAGELEHIDVQWMESAVDRLVLPVHDAQQVDRLVDLVNGSRTRGVGVVLAVDLRKSILEHLPDIARCLAAAEPAGVVFTWPFPEHDQPAPRAPRPGTWLQSLEDAVAQLAHASVTVTVKGLPICHFAGYPDLFRQTTNRWYVDAGHQREGALLFLPNVVQFTKSDACRFCSKDASCDGFFQAYLDTGHPSLRPI